MNMDKEQKAKEYAESLTGLDYMGEVEAERASLLVDASKELPEYDDSVWVINEVGEQFFCHRSNNKDVKIDKSGWCNYTGSDIIAWIRPVSFQEILEMNKDVLKRLKDR